MELVIFFNTTTVNRIGKYVRSTPHPVTVTTRIITFLVGNPYKPSFATVTGWGVDPRNMWIHSCSCGCQPQNRGVYLPKWMVKIMENPMNKWMIFGGTIIFGNTHVFFPTILSKIHEEFFVSCETSWGCIHWWFTVNHPHFFQHVLVNNKNPSGRKCKNWGTSSIVTLHSWLRQGFFGVRGDLGSWGPWMFRWKLGSMVRINGLFHLHYKVGYYLGL